MKQFAFPIGVKCSNTDEYKRCIDVIKSIGDRRITDESFSSVYNYLHVFLTFTSTGIYESWGGHEENMYYIDHFNPALIRDIAAACTNDTWQDGEPIFDCVNNHMNYRNMHKDGCRKIDHYASLRRPTLAEICEHHGYEIKGKDIVKKTPLSAKAPILFDLEKWDFISIDQIVTNGVSLEHHIDVEIKLKKALKEIEDLKHEITAWEVKYENIKQVVNR